MVNQIVFLFLFAFVLILAEQPGLKAIRWLMLSLGVFLPLVTVAFVQPRFELDFFWWRIAGGLFVLIGLALLLWSWRQWCLAKVEKGENLLTAGPYAWVRHPQYLSLIFIYVGWWWVWSAVYSFYFGMFMLLIIWLKAYFEEKFDLTKKFGQRYLDYSAKTGMFWIK